ncbi:IclR family transcriptional regulator C-terminal domain-containing protein [Streptomyces sp. NPDC014685]|uniref:IclR family transcriptional regulator domain-containing protein n=1 Tax=Streptomyces sp. NPDC014685 TaxID=3364881 RepID=UPI0036FDC47C
MITPEALAEAVTETARREYGWVEQEPEERLRSLAAPVTDGRGQVVAAVTWPRTPDVARRSRVGPRCSPTWLRRRRGSAPPSLRWAAGHLSS